MLHENVPRRKQTTADVTKWPENGATRLEKPAARALQTITFSDEFISAIFVVMDCITVKAFYLAKKVAFSERIKTCSTVS